MATKKAEYFKFNQDGNVWDLYYFKTSADLIVETNDKKVLTGDERTKISNFLTTFNTANKLVQVGSGGKIPAGLIPDISDTYLKKNNPTFDGELRGNTGAFNFINAYNTTNNRLVIGSRLQEQDSTYITFKDNAEGEGEMELYAYAGIKLSSNNSVIDVSESWIRNVRAPMLGHEAVNKEYVDNKVSSGFTTRMPVKAASTGNVDITAVLNALDGFTLSANDRVLLKNQTTASQNGVYQLDSSKKPVKVTGDSKVGSAVFVENGNTNNDYIYHCSTENTWVAFSKPDTIKAGAGLSKSGTTLSIADGGITNAMIQSNTISLSKFNQWGLDDNFAYWNVAKNPQSNANPIDWLNSILSAIKLLRGTTNYNTSNTQTIAGAYTSISAVQNSLDTAIGTIPKITSGTSNPSTTGAKNGDLYFKELSTV
jgi:hypothetical protein